MWYLACICILITHNFRNKIAVNSMGCIICKFYNDCCKKRADESCLVPEPKREYSWDKKPKVSPKDFTIENIVDSEVLREPNSVNGRQIIIQNCKNSKILVLDHCNSVTIDDCTDCQIILGPTSGSLFVRGSENLCLVALCGQFRARDCRNMTTFLCCTSQPSIEACSKLDFGCALIQYKQLYDQVEKSGLSLFNNQWNLIYDFTPISSEGPNWQLIQPYKILEAIQINKEKTDQYALVLGEKTKSLVPYTRDSCKVDSSVADYCIIAITECCNQNRIAFEFISALNHDEEISLIHTKGSKIDQEEVMKLLPKHRKVDITLLNMIMLQFLGPGCATKCEEVSKKMSDKFSAEDQECVHISDIQTLKQMKTLFVLST